jgi:hypothetical protein
MILRSDLSRTVGKMDFHLLKKVKMALCVWLEDEMQRAGSCAWGDGKAVWLCQHFTMAVPVPETAV